MTVQGRTSVRGLFPYNPSGTKSAHMDRHGNTGSHALAVGVVCPKRTTTKHSIRQITYHDNNTLPPEMFLSMLLLYLVQTVLEHPTDGVEESGSSVLVVARMKEDELKMWDVVGGFLGQAGRWKPVAMAAPDYTAAGAVTFGQKLAATNSNP